jgi:hypothetical protein
VAHQESDSTEVSHPMEELDVGRFYRQCMLVIDGKYNSDDGLSIGRM